MLREAPRQFFALLQKHIADVSYLPEFSPHYRRREHRLGLYEIRPLGLGVRPRNIGPSELV